MSAVHGSGFVTLEEVDGVQIEKAEMLEEARAFSKPSGIYPFGQANAVRACIKILRVGRTAPGAAAAGRSLANIWHFAPIRSAGDVYFGSFYGLGEGASKRRM